jgi:hypothetical protein
MFSLLSGGFSTNNITGDIPIDVLLWMIKQNQHKERILKLHTLVKKCKDYDDIKEKLPCIKPHGTFDKIGTNDTLLNFSGYLFFDKDSCDPESTKQIILNNHADKVCMLGTSCGGNGIFFYVRLSNPKILTPKKFNEIESYFIKHVFRDLNLDTSSTGINRNHVIPYDPNVYYNPDATVSIPSLILNRDNNKEVKKCISQCNKKEREKNNIGKYTFLDIKEVNIKWKRDVEVGDADYIISDVEVCNLFFPRVIKDETKRYIFPAMVNSIMHNNPGIELIVILSFINFINENYTDDKPMQLRYMIFLVEREFNRIKEGGKIKHTRIKRVHTNPKLDTLTRVRIAAKVNGRLKQERSTLIVGMVYEALKEDGIKPTIERLAAVLEGRRSISIVQRYFPKDSHQLTKERPAVQELRFQKWLKEFKKEDFSRNHHRYLEEDKYYRIGYEIYLQSEIPDDEPDEGIDSEMALKWRLELN